MCCAEGQGGGRKAGAEPARSCDEPSLRRSAVRLDPSFNNLIRPQQQRRRDRKAESLRGFEIDDQLELRGLLDGEVGGPGALEDAARCRPGEQPPLDWGRSS